MDASIAAAPDVEPGAVENRISLNPNDPEFQSVVGDWENGNFYTLNDVRVEQISPGEFKVIKIGSGSLASATAPEETPEPQGPEEAEAPQAGQTGVSYPNPAVAKLMNR